MSITHTLIIINLVVWIPWLLIYKINPYFIQLKIRKKLQTHPEWDRLKKIENLLKSLFKNNRSYRISRKEHKQLNSKDSDFIYGEINFLSFFHILEKVAPKSGEVFYDLGCGAGKAVFASALFFDLSKACGIELLPGLCAVATANIKKANQLLKSFDKSHAKASLKQISRIQFINENFLDYQFTDADIVFINATCMKTTTWSSIVLALTKLKSGSRVIVTTKQIEDKQFAMIAQNKELMSWGISKVTIYRKINSLEQLS